MLYKCEKVTDFALFAHKLKMLSNFLLILMEIECCSADRRKILDFFSSSLNHKIQFLKEKNNFFSEGSGSEPSPGYANFIEIPLTKSQLIPTPKIIYHSLGPSAYVL